MNRSLDGIAKLVNPTVHADYALARALFSPTPERIGYVFNGSIKSAFQGGQLLGDQGDQPLGDQGDARVRWVPDPRAIRGVPQDGPASEDETYSTGKGKDKKMKSVSKPPVQGEGRERTEKVKDANAPRW